MDTPSFQQPVQEPEKNSFLNGNKGLIIAGILVAIVLVIVLRAFFSSESAQNYKGIIQKVESETEQRSLDNQDTQA